MGNIRVKITTVGKDFKTHQQDFLETLSHGHTEQMANDTRDAMQKNIQDSIGRANSTGNLEENITAEEIPGGHGVGNIERLNSQAPYWRHVNYGSVAIGANHSHLVPKGAFSPGSPAPVSTESGGRFEKGAGPYQFKPTQPIAPLSYIEKTVAEIGQIVEKVLRGFKS